MAEKRTGARKSSSDGDDGASSRKAPSKKAPSRKTPAKRAAPKAEAPRRATATQVAARAAQQLLELTGKEAEGVTGLGRADDGWTVEVEVVEVRRIPNTTDVLALYEVTTDDHGDLMGYRRLRRYTRGTPGGE
ncbi:gas vesicle protein GvpO [Nocardioides marmoribigeumensis]|uniref:Gas vesicle protein n=1 Tax=Nocardioides marmoribigeumensis TaxID=433649 RepID=A0ABU2BQ07_9ACTN|nr:gas vesicle protein GvpO [Nocardioides marmoribigeumensis]MDR7360727.1 hypothetical protein [Nocardioides marmoribigeumensis]